MVVPDTRRQELVMNAGIGQLLQHIAGIDESATQVGFVEVVVEHLVEASHLLECGALEQRIGALQVGEAERPGHTVFVEGTSRTRFGFGEAVRRAVAVLQVHARVVEHDATHTGHLRVGKGRKGLCEPIEFGQCIVVDEGDDLPGSSTDTDIARDRQVGNRAVRKFDLRSPRFEHIEGVIGRGSVHHHDFDVGMALMHQTAQRRVETIGAIEGADDDRDAHQSAGRVATISNSRQSPLGRPRAMIVGPTNPLSRRSATSDSGVNPVKWKSPAYSWPP